MIGVSNLQVNPRPRPEVIWKCWIQRPWKNTGIASFSKRPGQAVND
jgi:hypothetical protein